MKIPAFRYAALVGGVLLTVSACGSTSTSTGTGSTQSTSSTAAGSRSAGLHVASTSLGKIIVDGSGMTVYLLTSDKPNTSLCSSSCLSYWPAVAPSKATGITGNVAQTTTTAGKPIATVGGWPLYTYAGDQAAGDTTGQGVQSFGGTWYVVSATGKALAARVGRPSGGGSSSSGSGGGYGY